MIRKKVCLVGAFAVGKTSLVARFVTGQFSGKYITTVGFKIDRRTVAVDDVEIEMQVWDLAGEDDSQKVPMTYLRGADGYLLVADGTRRETLETARLLQQRIASEIGPLPFLLILNKADLLDEWEIDEQATAELAANGWHILQGSAKTGAGVEEAFAQLAAMMAAAKQQLSDEEE